MEQLIKWDKAHLKSSFRPFTFFYSFRLPLAVEVLADDYFMDHAVWELKLTLKRIQEEQIPAVVDIHKAAFDSLWEMVINYDRGLAI